MAIFRYDGITDLLSLEPWDLYVYVDILREAGLLDGIPEMSVQVLNEAQPLPHPCQVCCCPSGC